VISILQETFQPSRPKELNEKCCREIEAWEVTKQLNFQKKNPVMHKIKFTPSDKFRDLIQFERNEKKENLNCAIAEHSRRLKKNRRLNAIS
jgi:hypothetical protein